MTQSTNHHGNEGSEKDSRALFLPFNDNYLKDGDAKHDKRTSTSSESGSISDGDEIVCGYGAFTPSWLQRYKTIGWFTAFYSIASFVTSALSTYVSSQVTTLERYYNFSSSMSGFIMSCNDIGYLLTTLIMSYYSRRIHIPRGLSLSTFVFGVSGIVCVLAYAVTKDKHVGLVMQNSDRAQNTSSGQKSFDNLCVNLTLASNTTEDQTGGSVAGDMPTFWKYLAVSIIGIGMAIQGMAKSPRHPFLGVFIDDNVPKTQTAQYLGIISGTGIFGPAMAFMLGAVFSRIYVTLEDPGISVRDPRWIGAWWLGFLVFGGVALLAAIPIACFPRYLKGRRHLEGVDPQKKGVVSGEKKSPVMAYGIKGFFKSSGRLLTNPVYTLIVVGISFNLLGVAGYYSFAVKYIETQFTVPVFKASMTFGTMNVLSAALGSFLGGCIVSRLKFSPMTCVKFSIVCMILSSLALSMSFVFGCDQPYIHKATDVFSQNTSMSHCAANCNCDTQNFFPICGSDNRNYFSPCHAGCTGVLQSNVFVNCSCVSGIAADTSVVETAAQTATAGLCTPDCNSFYPFIAFMSLYALIACLTILPNFIIYVRAVDEKDKPLAIGVLAFSTAVLGWLPGPMVFGYIVDTCCELWNGKGACVLYDLSKFRTRFYGPMLAFRVFGLLTLIAVLLIATYSKSFRFQSHRDDENIDIDVIPDNDSDESIGLNTYDNDRKRKEINA